MNELLSNTLRDWFVRWDGLDDCWVLGDVFKLIGSGGSVINFEGEGRESVGDSTPGLVVIGAFGRLRPKLRSARFVSPFDLDVLLAGLDDWKGHEGFGTTRGLLEGEVK